MAYNYEYPYTDIGRHNSDWLLNTMKELQLKMDEFVNYNEIHFADPIDWNITKQYVKNTVVRDNNKAYLSKKAVPSGIAISDGNYWLNIGNFDIDGDVIRINIAPSNEHSNTHTEKPYNINDLMWWNNDLYIVTSGIPLGGVIIDDYNVERISIEEFINNYVESLNNEIENIKIQFTSNVETGATSTHDYNVGSWLMWDNSLYRVKEAISIGDSISTKVNPETVENLMKYNSGKVINVANYGIVGDGVTDVTSEINDLISIYGEGYSFYFPSGIYIIKEVTSPVLWTDPSEVGYGKLLGIKLFDDSIEIFGDGNNTIFKGIDPTDSIAGCIFNVRGSYIKLHDFEVYGNFGVHVNAAPVGKVDEWLYGIQIYKGSSNVNIDNVKCYKCHADGINIFDFVLQKNIYISNCYFEDCGRNGIQCGKCDGVYINNCYFTNMTGEQTTGSAIDIESHSQVTKNIFVDNCQWYNTVQGVAVNRVDNVHISNCTGEGSYSGIQTIYGEATYPEQPTEFPNGCIINNCSIDRIRVTSETTINNCNITSRLYLGDWAVNCTVNKVRVTGCNINALYIGNLYSSIIKGCRVFEALTTWDVNNTVIEQCDIIDNTFAGYLLIGGAKEVRICGNTIYGNTNFEGGTRGVVDIAKHENVIFCNNILKRNISNGFAIRFNEVLTDYSTIDFCNNTIRTNLSGATAIKLTGASIMFCNNNSVVSKASSYGMTIGGSSKLIASGNVIVDEHGYGLSISAGTLATGCVNTAIAY